MYVRVVGTPVYLYMSIFSVDSSISVHADTGFSPFLFLYVRWPNVSHIRHYFRAIHFTRRPNHIPKWDNKKLNMGFTLAQARLGGLARSWLH